MGRRGDRGLNQGFFRQAARLRRRWTGVRPALAAFLLLVLASCRGSEPLPSPELLPPTIETGPGEPNAVPAATPLVLPKTQSDDPVTLDWLLEEEPASLDLSLVSDQAAVDCTANIFVGLTRYDPDTSAVLPYLATHWNISDDGLVYTFYLREDIFWVKFDPDTGQVEARRPVTAQDVEFGVKRSLDPQTGSHYAYVLYIIKNAAPVHGGTEGLTLDDLGVRALNDKTVEFTLEEPASYFPAIAALWVAKPQPRELVETQPEDWTDLGVIWTNGPYMFTSQVPGQLLRFDKNPFWVFFNEVQIEVVNALVIIDAATGFALYEDNELDVARVPLSDLDHVREDPFLSQEYVRQVLPCTYYYGFTTTKPPFDDVRVRIAFSAALDRRRLVESTLEGSGQIPATSFAAPGTWGAPPLGTVGLGYDPALAQASFREFLDEMGLADAAAFNQRYAIVLGYNSGELHERIANAAQVMWEEVLGVTVRLEDRDWGDYLVLTDPSTPVEEMFHIFRSGWCADYPDENDWVRQVFHYRDGSNRTRRQCADPNCQTLIGPAPFDRLVIQAAEETDPELRAELYALSEEILARESAVAAFLYHHVTNMVSQSWLDRDYPLLGGANWYDWRIDWAIKTAVR